MNNDEWARRSVLGKYKVNMDFRIKDKVIYNGNEYKIKSRAWPVGKGENTETFWDLEKDNEEVLCISDTLLRLV